MGEECIFCKLAKSGGNIIYENDSFFSIFDVSPAIKGHALVISKKHFKTILDVPNTLSPELLEAIKGTSMKLVKDFGAEGFNLAVNTNPCAGQVVDHVHVHIFPRKKGDGYSLSIKKK